MMMTTRLDRWRGVIADEDIAIYEEAGFGRQGGLGRRPAVIAIDMQYRTLGEPRLPIREAIRQSYPTSCGSAGWAAVDCAAGVLDAARRSGLPVFVPIVALKQAGRLGRLGDKVPSIGSVDERGYQMPPQLAIDETDIVVPKDRPSAFFGTSLTSTLVQSGVDTVLLMGCTTSGCVRATAVDAFSYGYKVGVIEDAVYDRSTTSHQVGLFELSQKYGDLLTAREAISYMEGLVVDR